jgi:hypothetical protein
MCWPSKKSASGFRQVTKGQAKEKRESFNYSPEAFPPATLLRFRRIFKRQDSPARTDSAAVLLRLKPATIVWAEVMQENSMAVEAELPLIPPELQTVRCVLVSLPQAPLRSLYEATLVELYKRDADTETLT